jgi:hypothetical protein
MEIWSLIGWGGGGGDDFLERRRERERAQVGPKWTELDRWLYSFPDSLTN